jgi:hypothetical protein
MFSSRTRRILGLILLLVSLAILLWGLWPMAETTRVLPVNPGDMTLPTPEGYLWGVRAVL